MRVGVGALLALASVAAWTLAVLPLPGGEGAGRDFLLVDASASCGGPEAARVRLAASSLPGDRTWYCAAAPAHGSPLWTRADLREPPPAAASDLGAALAALRPRLESGDRLRIVTDGCVTDDLPPYAEWEGIAVEWERPSEGPRIASLALPPHWPAGATIQGELVLAAEPVGDATVAVAVTPPGALSAWDARPVAPGYWRLALTADPPPAKSVEIAVTVSDANGADRRSARIGRPGRVAWQPIAAADPASAPGAAYGAVEAADATRVAALLNAGWFVLVTADETEDWFLWSPALDLFRPAPPPLPRVLVLLDRSGSMDGGPLSAGVDAVLALVRAYRNVFEWTVLPFGAEIGDALDPARSEGAAALRELAAFGPTRLADALDAAAETAADDTLLLVVSDGAAEPPPEGWAAIGARLQSLFGAVHVVPLSAAAETAVLDAIGHRYAGGDLAKRMVGALTGGATTSAPAFAVDGLPWTVPEYAQSANRPRWRAAPGAVPLLVDRLRDVYAAARIVGRGLLVGACGRGGAPGRAWESMALEHLAAPRWERTAEGVLARGDATGWWAQQGEQFRDLRPAGPALWRATDFAPAAPITIRPPVPDGSDTASFSFELPPWRPGEWEATPEAFAGWVAGRDGAPGAPWRPAFLVAGLLLAVAALAWQRFAKAG